MQANQVSYVDSVSQTSLSVKKKGNLSTAAGEQAPANTPKAHVGTVSTNNITHFHEIARKTKRTNKWLSLNRLQLPVGENQYGSIK